MSKIDALNREIEKAQFAANSAKMREKYLRRKLRQQRCINQIRAECLIGKIILEACNDPSFRALYVTLSSILANDTRPGTADAAELLRELAPASPGEAAGAPLQTHAPERAGAPDLYPTRLENSASPEMAAEVNPVPPGDNAAADPLAASLRDASAGQRDARVDRVTPPRPPLPLNRPAALRRATALARSTRQCPSVAGRTAAEWRVPAGHGRAGRTPSRWVPFALRSPSR